MDSLEKLMQALQAKLQTQPDPSSYTQKLFAKGIAEICKKFGEEAVEVVVATLSGTEDQVVSEAADMLYHLVCICVHNKIPLSRINQELNNRLTTGKKSDKLTN
jgi:phosphoribosyl-ATP pyrophosphohydrolase